MRLFPLSPSRYHRKLMRELRRLGFIASLTPTQLSRAAIERGAIQKQTELAQLLRLVRSSRMDCTVEIGTAQGGTLYALCRASSRSALIVSIDLPGGEFGGGYDEVGKATIQTYARAQQRIHFLQADSHAPDTRENLVRVLDGRSIDFLMIDGDHTYSGVKSDFEMYAPLVRRGGLIGFHDIVHHDQVPECQVDRFWADLRENHQTWEFIDDGDSDRGWGNWGGIGVVRVP
jgi:cephalosporin hydroxylase